MKASEMTSLAVLITVHNRREKTIDCLSNLYAQQLRADVRIKVYVVDDGSTDGTAQAIKERFPQTYLISADGSLYWNRGMHLAWQRAACDKDYDYYLWLNDDTVLLQGAICELLATSANKINEAIVVGATQNRLGNKLTYGGRIGKQIASCDGIMHEVDFFNGNIVLIPQKVYHKLGNLDYYYRHSKGDYDYGIRARKAGIRMFQCGNVLGICEEHAQIDSWCDPAVSFHNRWKMMHLPNGMPPHEMFHLEKQINILMACVHFITIYIRCLFPQLWMKRISRR